MTGYYQIMTKGKDWKAMLAKLCADVERETQAPMPKALREAFAQQGHTIPELAEPSQKKES
jgi:hypothetical protein